MACRQCLKYPRSIPEPNASRDISGDPTDAKPCVVHIRFFQFDNYALCNFPGPKYDKNKESGFQKTILANTLNHNVEVSVSQCKGLRPRSTYQKKKSNTRGSSVISYLGYSSRSLLWLNYSQRWLKSASHGGLPQIASIGFPNPIRVIYILEHGSITIYGLIMKLSTGALIYSWDSSPLVLVCCRTDG